MMNIINSIVCTFYWCGLGLFFFACVAYVRGMKRGRWDIRDLRHEETEQND